MSEDVVKNFQNSVITASGEERQNGKNQNVGEGERTATKIIMLPAEEPLMFFMTVIIICQRNRWLDG